MTPRKIQLEFTCDLGHCKYGDRKCISSDTETEETYVCPNLNATVPRIQPEKAKS